MQKQLIIINTLINLLINFIKLSQIIIYQPNLNNLQMLPVKPNNLTKSSRTNNRNNPTQKQVQINNGKVNSKLSRRKDKKKNGGIHNSKDTSDTGEQLQQTISTGALKNKNNDGKSTVRKINFDNKPVIKDLTKRLNNYSKQYVPEYFTRILQYTIEKELQNTISPVSEKISRWRFFIQRQRQIQVKVAKQLNKMNNMLITSRKKLKQQIKRQRRKYDHNSEDIDDKRDFGTHSFKIQNNSDVKNKEENSANKQVSSQCSSLSPSVENYSCPQVQRRQDNLSASSDQKTQEQKLTDQMINKLWNSRFDKFASMIETLYELIGQYQCTTTIFPICYILYSMVTSDPKTFDYLDKNYEQKPKSHASTQNFRGHYNNNQIRMIKSNADIQSKFILSQSSSLETLQYYMIVSILIGTKYHQIYPASLVDLIQSINCSLSYEKAIKIQGQVLQILNFGEFFTENQNKFLKMFGVVAAWTNSQINVCQFILESGLNNPKLYAYSPLYKAAVVMGIYQEKFFKTQEKFMVIRNLCPGLTLDLVSIIKKEYSQILVYNNKNNFMSQRKKFFIFQNQMKTLTKGISNI